MIGQLGAIPYIELNPWSCKGNGERERMARRKKLCGRFYKKDGFTSTGWIPMVIPSTMS
ncbi:MAG: hypothetical protein ACE5QF_02470 [Thermoplasmata archaeon]